MKRKNQLLFFQEHLFIGDVKRMFANCYKFNGYETPYYMHGYKLNELFNKLVKTHFPNSKLHAKLPYPRPTHLAKKSL